jgi:putative sterol carrier protein
MSVGDFIRVATGAIDPAEPVLKGRAFVEGDLGVAARLPEMFKAARPV